MMASTSRDVGGPVTIEPQNFIFYDAGESVAYECELSGLVKYGVIEQTQVLIIQGLQSNDIDSNPDIPVQLFELVAEGVLKLRPGPPIAVKKSNILWNITVLSQGTWDLLSVEKEGIYDVFVLEGRHEDTFSIAVIRQRNSKTI